VETIILKKHTRISGKITTIFNDFLHWSDRTCKTLPKSINEHNFLLLCVMFSFTHTFKTLVNILKNTVSMYEVWFSFLSHFLYFLSHNWKIMIREAESVFWYLGKGESYFIILKNAFMSSYNVKIQFNYVENWIKCETMYF
jgi:hypothetical protein